MIVVHDNGAGYSDHTITFIDVRRLSLEALQRLLQFSYPGGFVLATCQSMSWVVPDDGCMSLESFLGGYGVRRWTQSHWFTRLSADEQDEAVAIVASAGPREPA